MKTITLTLITSLFLVSSSHANPIFTAEWTKGLRMFPGQWQYLHAVGKDRLRPERDPSSPKGGTVARVEVRPGDKVISSERSEVCMMQDSWGRPLPVRSTSGHEYYGISVKLDLKWQAPQPNAAGYAWGTFFQLHGPDSLGASPSIALMAEKDFHLDVCGGDVMDGGKRTKPKGVVSLPYTDGSLNLGRWNQFLVDVVWAADNTGSITIYRRNEGKMQWIKVLEKQNTPTLQYGFGQQVGDHYWKTGFYRSESSHTNLLWLGPIVRGNNRNEVAVAAFGMP